ncbi:uncharacterized protein LOC131229359 isoform X2 [Magnolia sinica]|uniref:uncharacterized protein LOC131229359 isoform X2 n=1 Tax=Magnolia sinica TaxID=86752 RepID=UPI00265958C6|nr:uncharacterized protein LOC131229359 isoform X2 [Magnolia sinica]
MKSTGVTMEAAAALITSKNPPIRRPQFWIKPLKSLRHPGPHRSPLFPLSSNRQLSLKCFVNIPNEKPFGELGKVKTHADCFAGRLWETFPEPVKEFPWKRAEEMVLQSLFVLGRRALKWALITLFVASSLSDVIFAISRNQELSIPVGLFLGCTMADFLKQTSQELFPITKEHSLFWHLIGTGSFFVVVKFISLYLAIRGRVFLSHVGNGGLMQTLWLGMKLQEEAKDDESEKQTPSPPPDQLGQTTGADS